MIWEEYTHHMGSNEGLGLMWLRVSGFAEYGLDFRA